MEYEALVPTETLAGTEGQINRWLREYMRGGPDRCEECLRLGALPEVVEKARDARRQWNADQYADAECAPIIDPPRTAGEHAEIRGAAAIGAMPAAGAAVAGSTGPSSDVPSAGAQAESALPSSAPVLGVSPVSSTASAPGQTGLSWRRRHGPQVAKPDQPVVEASVRPEPAQPSSSIPWN